MVRLIRKCTICSKYTFKDYCPTCGQRTSIPHPPRFSLPDKYVAYRIKMKKHQ